MRPESRDLALLWDMAVSMRRIHQYIDGHTRDEFEGDVGFQDQVVWRFVLVGEAATRISPELRDKHPDLPWRAIVGLRNVVVHQYDRIDLGQVWRAATEVVPTLLPRIIEILTDSGHEPPEE